MRSSAHGTPLLSIKHSLLLALVVAVCGLPSCMSFASTAHPIGSIALGTSVRAFSSRYSTPGRSTLKGRGLQHAMMQGDFDPSDLGEFLREKMRPRPGGWFKLVPLGILLLIATSLHVVPPGNLGIASTFGTVAEKTLGSGLHVTTPLTKVIPFSTKTILLEQQNHVPTREGLSVDLDVAVLYHIDATKARDIFLTIGDNYEKVVLAPEVASAVRGLTSESDAKALYTEGRSEIQKQIKTELQGALAPRGIVVEDVLLKAVKLPAQLTHSIELKAQSEQESARMSFVLDKERQEAERKSIEAKGISDFQNIVSKGISPQLLQWKGIEATEKLANSPNAKIVIVGNGNDGLPVILSSPDSK